MVSPQEDELLFLLCVLLLISFFALLHVAKIIAARNEETTQELDDIKCILDEKNE